MQRSPRNRPTSFQMESFCPNLSLFLSAVRLRGDGRARAGGRGRCAGASVRGTSRPGTEDEPEPHLPGELLGTVQGDHGHRPDAERGRSRTISGSEFLGPFLKPSRSPEYPGKTIGPSVPQIGT